MILKASTQPISTQEKLIKTTLEDGWRVMNKSMIFMSWV